jgi:hypothetical protein
MASTARLNAPLGDFLRRLHKAEIDARGPDRRIAFRRTREAIGAALGHGVLGTELAECLGVTVASIRNRADQLGGTMTAAEIRQLTTLSSRTVSEAIPHQLIAIEGDSEPERRYRIDDVVLALLALPD